MRAAAAALAAGLLAAGCGGSDERAATPTPTPSRDAPEAQPGGAGDEQPIRQPVRLTIGAGGVTPRLVKVSAFLSVELVVRNETAEEQIVSVRGAKRRRAISVGKGETRRLRVTGLRRGRYRIDAGQAGHATLVVSLDEP